MVKKRACKPALLIDSNVWVDNYLGEREGHEEACALID